MSRLAPWLSAESAGAPARQVDAGSDVQNADADHQRSSRRRQHPWQLKYFIGFQLVQIPLALIMLGLSASIYRAANAKSDDIGPVRHIAGLRVAEGFCAFAASWGLINAFFGLATSPIPDLRLVDSPTLALRLVFGALTVLFYLAGALRLAVLVTNSHCPLKNGYCAQLRANDAFLFICCIINEWAFQGCLALAGHYRKHKWDNNEPSPPPVVQTQPDMRAPPVIQTQPDMRAPPVIQTQPDMDGPPSYYMTDVPPDARIV